MRGKVFTLASVALLSCRAVLGIEDLDDPKADAGPSAESGTDAGPKPGNDAAPDSPATNPCWTDSNCGKCCRDKDMAANATLQTLLGGCACDGGCGATNDCNGTKVCGGQTEPAGTGCVPCLDRMIRDDTCGKATVECGKTPACKAVYDCVAGCP